MHKVIFLIFIVISLTGSLKADKWELAWSEEFNYTGLPDSDKWTYEEGFVRNAEMQYYTKARKENVRVENGVLIIEGKKEEFSIPQNKKKQGDSKKKTKIAHYTSGSINTRGKAAFLYGRIEVRAKLPFGKGVWPAIWMMGVNRTDTGWPYCGEIDIMEYVGKDPHKIHACCHFANPDIKNKSSSIKELHKKSADNSITIQDPYNNFHIYAIEWDKKEIKFFVDDKHYSTLNINIAGKGSNNPFRKPHYLLLNFALGGSWGGRIDDSILPKKYKIDYVRYYRKKIETHSPVIRKNSSKKIQ